MNRKLSMKLHLHRKLPDSFYIAFSGGIDSVVLAHKAISQKKDITLVFYHHGNFLADQEVTFVREFSSRLNIPLIVQYYTGKQPVSNKEKFWRDCRYNFFHSLDRPVATAHHLDDVLEWYLFTCLRGEGHLMEEKNKNIFRPLLLVTKKQIEEYQEHLSLRYFKDPTNMDVEFSSRNKIRHEIIPKALEVNPGLYTTIKKKLVVKIGNSA